MSRVLPAPAVAALLVTCLVVTCLLAAGQPAGGATEPLEPTVVTATAGRTSAALGTKVAITGVVTAEPGRAVTLQMRTTANGWQDVTTARTASTGGFRFRAPAWLNRHRLRVVAPATAASAAGVSETVAVRVRPAYRPAGRASDWSWSWSDGPRWDPCRTITYRVRTTGGYPGSLRHLKRAFREISSATGLRFAYLGRSSRVAIRHPNPRDTDILVSWATPRQVPALAGPTAGIGGSARSGVHLVDGVLVLDAGERRLPRGFRSDRPSWGMVMVHEIAHTLGLGHADGASQLMHPVATRRNTRLGAGDLAGLHSVGAAAGCLAPLGSGRLRHATKVRP